MRRKETVVKELRMITANWRPEYISESDVPAWLFEQLVQARSLVEELPAFRAAPQGRLENTVRSIEAVFSSYGYDLSKTEFRPKKFSEDDMPVGIRNQLRILRAVGLLLNQLHGIGLPPPYEGPIFDPKTGNVMMPASLVLAGTIDLAGTIENTPEPVLTVQPWENDEVLGEKEPF